MSARRKPKRQRVVASSVFLEAVPAATLASFDAAGMVLSANTRPRKLKTGWSIRLVWRNRTTGMSAVVTFRVSEDRVMSQVETAWHFHAVIHGTGEAADA